MWCEALQGRTVIIMGSKRDLDFCRKITESLKVLGVNYELRVASAHKTPRRVLEILKEFKGKKIVYITVAGRSNALSAFVDANTTKPVIACPPYSDKFGGADIYSSLRVPSGIGSVVTIEPEGAALAAAKILAVEDDGLEKSVEKYQLRKQVEVNEANDIIRKLE